MTNIIRIFSMRDDVDLCLDAERTALLDAGMGKESVEQKAQESLGRIENELGKDSYCGFTAVEDGTPVGLIFVDLDGDSAFIDNLFVASDRRGQGVGQSLLRHAIEHLRVQKVKTIDLMVTSDNETAVNLYQKLGFEVSRLRMTRQLDIDS